MSLVDMACHVIACLIIQATRAHNTFDDVASTIHPSLLSGLTFELPASAPLAMTRGVGESDEAWAGVRRWTGHLKGALAVKQSAMSRALPADDTLLQPFRAPAAAGSSDGGRGGGGGSRARAAGGGAGVGAGGGGGASGGGNSSAGGGNSSEGVSRAGVSSGVGDGRD
jgi:hypothetical protein